MQRPIPLWLAVVIVILAVLIIAGVLFWKGRVATPGGGPPALTPSEAQTGY